MYQKHCYTLLNKAVEPPEVIDVSLTEDDVKCLVATSFLDVPGFIPMVERDGKDVTWLFDDVEEAYDAYWREGEGVLDCPDYSPSCPWNAPGMRVSDFI